MHTRNTITIELQQASYNQTIGRNNNSNHNNHIKYKVRCYVASQTNVTVKIYKIFTLTEHLRNH